MSSGEVLQSEMSGGNFRSYGFNFYFSEQPPSKSLLCDVLVEKALIHALDKCP